MTKKSYHQNHLNDMFKKHLSSFTILFLLVLLLFIMEACDYKRAKYFSPTDSIPGQINLITPQLVSPPNGSMDVGMDVTFEWQMVDQATGYDIQIIELGESFQNANGFSQYGLTTNMYPVEKLKYQTNYQWRARATAGDIFSDWSDAWGFMTMMEPVTTYNLNVEKEGEGTVTSNDNNINCGNVCSEEYEEGTEVTLTAEAADGWEFDGWSGDVPGSCNDESESCTIVMDGVKTVKATFIEKERPKFVNFFDLFLCIEHPGNSSEILWLLFYEETYLDAYYTVTMRITLPNGNDVEIEATSAANALKILLALEIFTTGNYQWEIVRVYDEFLGEEVEFGGLISGEVNVGHEEQNPDQCTE